MTVDRMTVTGGRSVRGTIRVPGDKSVSHRALLLAALAEGTSVVRGLSNGDDVECTRAAMAAMGVSFDGDQITGGDLHEPDHVIDVGNSGTGIRLLAGWCSARPWLTILEGDSSIVRRPMERVVEPLTLMGAKIDGRQGGSFPPLVIRGGHLRGIDYQLPVPSAQVKGSILLAGLNADGETIVRESVPSRIHTEELLVLAGADIDVTSDVKSESRVVRVRRSELSPFTLDVPADPSQAAFWIVAACVTPDSDVLLENVYVGPARAGFLDVLRRMGANIEVVDRGMNTADIRARSSDLKAAFVGGAEIPGLIDEIPILAVAAAMAEGTTTFSDAAELRVKESDRVMTVFAMLEALGADVYARSDGLVVKGGGLGALHGGDIDSYGDHRIAMSAAIAGLSANGVTTIDGWSAVATSYPGFDEELQRCAS